MNFMSLQKASEETIWGLEIQESLHGTHPGISPRTGTNKMSYALTVCVSLY
jgi:hypothetical protein